MNKWKSVPYHKEFQNYLSFKGMKETSITHYFYALAQLARSLPEGASLLDYPAISSVIVNPDFTNRRNIARVFRSYARFLQIEGYVDKETGKGLLEAIEQKPHQKSKNIKKWKSVPHSWDFRDYMRLKGYSNGTITHYFYGLAQLARELPQDSSLLDFKAVSSVLASPKRTNRKNIVQCFRLYVKFLQIEGYIDKKTKDDLLETIQQRKERGTPNKVIKKWSVPKAQWVKYIHRAPNKIAKMAIWLGFHFGLRAGEILHLRLQDVNFDDQVILIRPQKQDEDHEEWIPKSNRSREIPFGRTQAKVLRKWIQDRPNLNHSYLLWQPTTFKRLPSSTFYYWTTRAGLRPHVLRYSFATHYSYEAGMNLKTLSLLLGHTNISITSDYLQIDKKIGFAEARSLMDA
ncbi:MAG: tyrosine-type recombinase/integrase [Candidatus Hodarchaeales archaeon]|jgi:integrase